LGGGKCRPWSTFASDLADARAWAMAVEVEEVRKEVEELYRELVRRKYERAREKGASEQALANFIALHEAFLPAFVEKEMKWIEIIEEEKREGDFLLRRWPAGAKRLIKKNKLLRECYKL
jgi:hypothetical protein